MITRKTRRGIITLVILASVSFWINRQYREESQNPVADIDPKLDYVLRDFELQVFDENGRATLNMQAPVLRNNPELGLGTIEQPVIVMHQPEATWHLSADTATVTEDKEFVELSGHVFLRQLELDSGDWVEFNTHEVQLAITPQIATTSEAVELYDGRNHMSAVGMRLDMKSKRYRFNNQVKGTYAVD